MDIVTNVRLASHAPRPHVAALSRVTRGYTVRYLKVKLGLEVGSNLVGEVVVEKELPHPVAVHAKGVEGLSRVRFVRVMGHVGVHEIE